MTRPHFMSAIYEAVLKALDEAGGGPLKADELARRSGLFRPELYTACRGLIGHDYIHPSYKMEKIPIGERFKTARVASYRLTDKGRAYRANASKPNTGEPVCASDTEPVTAPARAP